MPMKVKSFQKPHNWTFEHSSTLGTAGTHQYRFRVFVPSKSGDCTSPPTEEASFPPKNSAGQLMWATGPDAAVATGCTNSCPSNGVGICLGGATYKECILRPDGCLGWSGTVACPSGHTCSGGKCVAPPPVRIREVIIHPGSFLMGSLLSEPGRSTSEVLHTVRLTTRFAIWTTEVTQGDFLQVMGYNPSLSKSCGSSCPVENVTWHEALAFCNQLSKRAGLPQCFDCSGGTQTISCGLKTAFIGNGGRDYYKCKGYRLPTEAEWEYAYRAGTTTAFYNGSCTQPSAKDPNLEKIGWYRENSGSTTHPVGKKTPNAWGLHDMAGNVWEWVWDPYGSYPSGSVTDPVGPSSGSYRVNRGGGWSGSAGGCRAGYRNYDAPGGRGDDLGFRLCRSAP